MNRRTILKGGLVLAATAHTAINPDYQPAVMSIDDFLSKATPDERVKFFSDGLTQAMAEIHPSRVWRSAVDHDGFFSLVVGDEPSA